MENGQIQAQPSGEHFGIVPLSLKYPSNANQKLVALIRTKYNSYAEFCKACDISKSHMNRIIYNKCNLTQKIKLKISKALELDSSQIWSEP